MGYNTRESCDQCNSCDHSGNGCNPSDSSCGCNPLKSFFFSMPPAQFSLVGTLLGLLLAEGLDLNQQNSLGNFLVSAGQAMLTEAAQGATLQSSTTQNVRQQILNLKQQINHLEQGLKN